jgi:hypothetical protein
MSIQKWLVDTCAPYEGLRWTVEVVDSSGGGGKWWEPIAAFNAREIAVDYAKRCNGAAADMGHVYRVRERGDDGHWIVVGSLADSGRGVKDRYGQAKSSKENEHGKA